MLYQCLNVIMFKYYKIHVLYINNIHTFILPVEALPGGLEPAQRGARAGAGRINVLCIYIYI